MGTTADKLAKLAETKADLKAALSEKGQTVGDVFSEYPAAVRAIESGGIITTRDYDEMPDLISGFFYGEFSYMAVRIILVEDGSIVFEFGAQSGGGFSMDSTGAFASSEQFFYGTIAETPSRIVANISEYATRWELHNETAGLHDAWGGGFLPQTGVLETELMVIK